MKTIRLYGFLGEQFGTHHMRDVADGAEALRAMSATVPGFEEALIQEQTYGFQIFYDEELTTEHIKNPTNCEVIKIVPVLLAAKDGISQVLVGVALMVVAYYTFGLGNEAILSWSAAGDSAIAATMTHMGFAIALGGVASLLANSPQSSQGSLGNAADTPTYVFSGPVNTTAQGEAIPVLYGRLRVGSLVASSGIDANSFYKGHGNPSEAGVIYGDGDSIPWSWVVAPVLGV